MSTSSPSTPDATPQRKMAAVGRSFTTPAKMSTTSRANPTAEIGATEGVETLYIHPNGKIVKFASATISRPGSSHAGASSQGTLPWANTTEQTLSAGPIQIYRVPGSVSFLHSGSLLHAIMPRSNCWCVDGVSKFAIRVLADTYYRIELPGESPEDLEKVEEFKETLKKVLFYERTACPFARTFIVELPKEPEVKKRRRKSHGPAKKWRLDKSYSWKPEDGGEPPPRESEESGGTTGSDEESSSSNDEAQSQVAEDTDKDKVKGTQLSTPTRPSVRERAMGLNMRSVTAPPQMALHSTPPSRLRTSLAVDNPIQEEASKSSSEQREPGTLEATALRPFQPIPTDMPPSPPDSSAGYDYSEQTTALIPDQNEVSRTALPQQETYAQEEPSTSVSNAQPSAAIDEKVPPAELSGQRANEWDAKPRQFDTTMHVLQDEGAGRAATTSHSQNDHVFVTAASADVPNATEPMCTEEELVEINTHMSLPKLRTSDEATTSGAEQPVISALTQESDTAVASAIEAEPIDPFAQIQARIQARRSIGGTTSFHPSIKSPTRQSSVSTASSLSSSKSGASLRSHASQQQQALATALVKKACSVFLGPPAQLVMIMLRIAARFAKGAFPGSFLFESPAGMSKRVPGSFDLDGSDVEDLGLDDDDWDEDDFGVPLRSPVRLATLHETLARTLRQESVPVVRERNPATGWDVD